MQQIRVIFDTYTCDMIFKTVNPILYRSLSKKTVKVERQKCSFWKPFETFMNDEAV